MKSRWNLQSALHLKAYILLLLKKAAFILPVAFLPLSEPVQYWKSHMPNVIS